MISPATIPTATATAPPISLMIQNVVAVAKIADLLDLAALAVRIPGAELNPRRFPGLIVRSASPRFAALVFRPGKLVLTGLPHPDAIPAALAAALEVLTAAGADVAPRGPPKIVNLVASGKFPDGIALHRMAIALNLEHIEYEPESFPGLVYRPPHARGVVLAFATGSIVVTGARSIDDAAAAAAELAAAVTTADAWRPAE